MPTLHLPPPKPLTPASPEFDAFLEAASRRLQVIRAYRELRSRRARAARVLADIDAQLAQCAEPLRLALLDEGGKVTLAESVTP